MGRKCKLLKGQVLVTANFFSARGKQKNMFTASDYLWDRCPTYRTKSDTGVWFWFDDPEYEAATWFNLPEIINWVSAPWGMWADPYKFAWLNTDVRYRLGDFRPYNHLLSNRSLAPALRPSRDNIQVLFSRALDYYGEHHG